MKLTNELCILYLKASGWMDKHDREIKKETIDECIEVVERYTYDCSIIEKLEKLKESKNELPDSKNDGE